MKDDFDPVLDRYFALKGRWTLFQAICLLEKIDPEMREHPIVDEPAGGVVPRSGDPTVRWCKVTTTSIDDAICGNVVDDYGNPNLAGRLSYPEKIGAEKYTVDPRKFVAWAVKRWPGYTDHLRDAEKRYQDKKKFIGLTSDEKKEAARQEFLRVRPKTLKLFFLRCDVLIFGSRR